MRTVRVIQEHSDALEADLMEFFQADLLDLWRGRLSLRKIGVYIDSLMRKQGRSTLLASIEPAAEWTIEAYIAARIADAAELSNYYFIQANSGEDTEIEAPTPITRPGQPEPEKPEPEFASGEEVASFFQTMSGM